MTPGHLVQTMFQKVIELFSILIHLHTFSDSQLSSLSKQDPCPIRQKFVPFKKSQ